jgi:hypothetical protein
MGCVEWGIVKRAPLSTGAVIRDGTGPWGKPCAADGKIEEKKKRMADKKTVDRVACVFLNMYSSHARLKS